MTSELCALTDDLRQHLAAAGIRIDTLPCDPRPEHEVPLQLTTSRYVAMHRHFDTIGPAGRRMMRRTASTQVCLDWWPGRAGLEQWQVLNLAGPFLAARFARSTGREGRLAAWLDLDPARTGFDDRLLQGDPIAAYTEFAAGATVFVTGGPADHLTTLFPPVRPRATYLEVRFLDAQEAATVGQVVTALSTLMYDDDRRRQALQELDARASSPGRTLARRRDGRPGHGRPRPRTATRPGASRMNVLFVTDPLVGLQADIDATIGLMIATQDLGLDVWYCEPAELSVANGNLQVRAHRLQLRPRLRPTGGDHRWLVDQTWFDELGTEVSTSPRSTWCTCASIRPSTSATSTRPTCSTSPRKPVLA